MQLNYEIDYGLPFIHRLVKLYKPALFVDIETRKRYSCIYDDGTRKVAATGTTPFDALENWVKKFAKKAGNNV
ncbi:MAG: hypothetical protein QM764_21920 [Chitinophagaceae bacterium]